MISSTEHVSFLRLPTRGKLWKMSHMNRERPRQWMHSKYKINWSPILSSPVAPLHCYHPRIVNTTSIFSCSHDCIYDVDKEMPTLSSLAWRRPTVDCSNSTLCQPNNKDNFIFTFYDINCARLIFFNFSYEGEFIRICSCYDSLFESVMSLLGVCEVESFSKPVDNSSNIVNAWPKRDPRELIEPIDLAACLIDIRVSHY